MYMYSPPSVRVEDIRTHEQQQMAIYSTTANTNRDTPPLCLANVIWKRKLYSVVIHRTIIALYYT